MIYLFVGYALIWLIDFPVLISEKKWKNLVFTSIIFCLGLVFAALYVADVEIKSPMAIFGDFFKNVLHLSY